MCSSCGNKYNKQRETSIFTKLFRYKHRHVVFTIAEELRPFFRQDRRRFQYLFDDSSKFKTYTELIKYVCRYVALPVMAESRIIDYDGTYVTFWYQRHKDDLVIIEKVHAFEFISRLIIHIPDKNFKQIRFYDAYHNFTKIAIDMNRFLSEEKAKVMKSLNTWKVMITLSFSVNPLNCPVCNTFMEYNKSTYP